MKRSFTDRLYLFNIIACWLFIIVCICITLLSGKLGITDLSIINVGIPTIFTELSIHTGFIIWKAKVENCRKFKDVNLLNNIIEESEGDLNG